MKRLCRQIIVVICAIAMLMTMPGVSVLAKNMNDEELIVPEVEELEEIVDFTGPSSESLSDNINVITEEGVNQDAILGNATESDIVVNVPTEDYSEEKNSVQDFSKEEIVESQNSFSAETMVGTSETPVDGNRYTVLLLDNSGSMSGTPLSVEKAAAIKFCKQMLAADGVNYISIVTYSTNVLETYDFSNQYTVLENYLNNMTANGGTNTNAALKRAATLLNAVPETATKNIVLLSDGLPESGDTITVGRYNSSDSYVHYEYANAVYNTAKNIDSSWNLYSLGFFHALSESDMIFARRLMSDLPANENMYYEVTDVNDLEFMFGKIADDLTQSNLKKIYIDQHINYINGTKYATDIIPGFGPLLSQILVDIREDDDVQSYNFLQNVNEALAFKLDLTQEYELLLANLMINDQTYKGIKDAYLSNLQSIMNDTLELVMNPDLFDIVGDSIKATDKERMVELFNKMMDESFLSDNYCQLHNEYTDIVNEYYSVGDIKKFLTKFDTVLDIADVALSTASETIEYYCFAQAYIDTTDDFIMTLGFLDYCADINAWASNIEGIDPAEQLLNLKELQTAIENFIQSMEAYKKDHAAAIASFAGNKLESKTCSKVAEKVTDLIFSKSPIFIVLPALKAGLKAKQTLTDLYTDLDDRAASGNMVEKLYIIAAMMDEVIEMFEDALESDYNSGSPEELLFRRAAQFDEAVNVYKTTLRLAADYGEEYEETLLKNETAKIIPSKKKVAWYSAAITLANVDKLRTNNILCHHEGLVYNHKSDIVLNTDRLKVFTIACPVDVDVLDNQGQRVAHLSDQNSVVEDDYSPYFYTLSNSNNECIKIVNLPDSSEFQILLRGTGNGKMNVYLGAYDGTEIYDEKKYSGITVEKNDQGYLSVDEENGFRKLVFDNIEYTEDDMHSGYQIVDRDAADDTIIITDSNQYYCAKNQTFTIHAQIQTPEGFDDGSKKFTGYIAVLQNWSWVQLGAWYIDGGTISVDLPVKIGDIPTGNKTFTVSLFYSDNFTTGASLYDCFFRVTILPESFVLSFDSDGGSCEKNSKEVTYGCVYGELPIPERDGYVFNGWFTEREGKGDRISAQNIVEVTSDQEVYASWVALDKNSILVEFDANGGRTPISFRRYYEGEKYGSLPIPKKNGSRFVGWYTDKESGNLIDSNKLVTSRTLYAYWTNLPSVFTDVADKNSWYYDSVYWAVENGVTSGYGEGTFQPMANLSRAQTVMFLYKLAGQPDVSGLSDPGFKDVTSDKWYYNAVKWAVSNEITSGYGEGTFQPNVTCNRAMIVTFLMRYAKLAGTYAAPTAPATFTDVPADVWYREAVDWAVANGVTTGYGEGTFQPMRTCNRAMMVTFLKRVAELSKVFAE